MRHSLHKRMLIKIYALIKKKNYLCPDFLTIYKRVQSSLQRKKVSRNFCLTEILQVTKFLILTSV